MSKGVLDAFHVSHSALEGENVTVHDRILILYLIGYMTSAISCSFFENVTDKYGRRLGVMLCGLLFVASAQSMHATSTRINHGKDFGRHGICPIAYIFRS